MDRALEHAPVALQVLEWPRPLTPASVALIDAAVEAYLAAGRLEEAERVVEGLRSAEVGQGQPYVQRSLGRLAAAQGRHDEAMELFRSVSDFFASVGYRDEEWRSRCLLAASLAALGERSAAGRELRAVLSGATRHGALFHARAAREALSALGLPADDGDEVEEVDEDGRTPAHERPAAVGAPAGPPTERLVTVLFADVRDYTAMTAALPPHEVAERIAALQRWAKHEIERHHGLVDKFAGDAVMATFNASSDRLDHARLALEAALAIRDKAALAGLAVGVGIATGGAIVGRLAEGANVSAIGETTNVAARLQAAAPGGTILLSEEAHRRVREWLRERAMEPEPRTLELKGFEHPVTAHALAASVSPTAPTRERRQRG